MIHQHLKKVLFAGLAFCCISAIPVQAAWTNYTSTNNSKIGTNFSAAAVDSQGNKWFGSIKSPFGLIKYNDTTWTGFNKDSTHSLPDNHVQALTVDRSGNLWVGTWGGLAMFNGTTWTTFPVDSLPSTSVQSITIDAQNNVWVGTDAGIAKFNGTTWVRFSATENSYAPYDGCYNVHSIAIDKKGRKWVGTGAWVFLYNDTTWQSYNPYNNEGSGLLAFTDVYNVVVDTQNNIWFGSDQGISKLNGTAWSNSGFYNHGNDPIHTIDLDSKAKLWVGSEDYGIGTIKTADFSWAKIYDTASGINDLAITSIVFDKKNNVWATGPTGIYSLPGGVPVAYTTPHGNSGNPFSVVLRNNRLTLSLNKTASANTIFCSVINLSGRSIIQQSSPASSTATIALSSLPAGYYILNATAGQNKTTQRLIITGKGVAQLLK